MELKSKILAYTTDFLGVKKAAYTTDFLKARKTPYTMDLGPKNAPYTMENEWVKPPYLAAHPQ